MLTRKSLNGPELTVSRQVTSPGESLPTGSAREGLNGSLGGTRLPGWYRLDRLVPVTRENSGPVIGLVGLRGTRRCQAAG